MMKAFSNHVANSKRQEQTSHNFPKTDKIAILFLEPDFKMGTKREGFHLFGNFSIFNEELKMCLRG